MNIKNYEVRGSKVKFSCPHCGERLTTKLTQAGSKDKCPSCGGEFVCAGAKELKEYFELNQARMKDRAKKSADKRAKSKLKKAQRLEQKVEAKAEAVYQRELGRDLADALSSDNTAWSTSMLRLACGVARAYAAIMVLLLGVVLGVSFLVMVVSIAGILFTDGPASYSDGVPYYRHEQNWWLLHSSLWVFVSALGSVSLIGILSSCLLIEHNTRKD